MDRKKESERDMNTKEEIRQAGSNIFADLKLCNAEELNAKAQIAYRICQIMDERKLTQKEAAQLLGIDQPKVSALVRGQLIGFSSDRLFRFLNALNRDVEITIKPTKRRNDKGHIRILAAA